MPTVDFVTFCCPKDVHKLHAPGVVAVAADSHRYPFHRRFVLHQHLAGVPAEPLPTGYDVVDVDDSIIDRYVTNPADLELADHDSGPPNKAHYWKNHTMNHLTGMEVSGADYIVFQDADITIHTPKQGRSWIEDGIEVLRGRPDCLMVTPNWGGVDGIVSHDHRAWYVNTVSQQIFLIERARMRGIDFQVPWNWEKLAPFGPMQEFYHMLEGRLWRYIDRSKLFRGVLKGHRYWHSQW